jgi:hypothetical protein
MNQPSNFELSLLRKHINQHEKGIVLKVTQRQIVADTFFEEYIFFF